jgi:hypothetical protein
MAESDNILTKLQDLLVYLIPQLNKFPRDQKFVLGDRIETKLLDVQEDCLRAYYSRDKRGHLLEANLQLEVARHLVRLANTLKLFSSRKRARPCRGGGYSVSGGFWSLINVVQTAGLPNLVISYSGTSVIVSWVNTGKTTKW